MKKLVAIGILAFLVAGAAGANPFYKNRKHVYNARPASGSKIFYKAAPSFNPNYVYHNIRVVEPRQRAVVNMQMKRKPVGPMAKNLHPAKNQELNPMKAPGLLVLLKML